MRKKKDLVDLPAPKNVEVDAAATSLADPIDTNFGLGSLAKKSAKKMPVFNRKERIDALVADVCSVMKDPTALQRADDFANTFLVRRPTGIISLDIACGGGLPIGGITRIQGKASSGKNYLVNMIFKTVQDIFKDDAALGACMVETVFDKEYAKKCGARIAYSDEDIRLLERAREERGLPPLTPEELAYHRDQIGHFIHSNPKIAESALETAERMIASNSLHAMVVDSFGALLTEKEEEKDYEEARKVGDVAMLVTRFVTHILPIFNRVDESGRPNCTAVIVLDQHRERIDSGRGSFDNDGGINALRHGKLLDIQLNSGRSILLNPNGPWDPSNPVVGKEVHWKIVKAKAGAHEGPHGTFNLYFGKHGYGFGADLLVDLVRTGVLYNVIDRAGAWYSYKNIKLGQGETKAGLTLASDKNLYNEVRNEIFRAANVTFLTQEPF